MSSPPSSQFVSASSVPVHKAWTWCKARETKDKWEPLFGYLQNSRLLLFTSNQTTIDNLITTVHLDRNCVFQYSKEKNKENSGFSFTLRVGGQNMKFKVKSRYERELWKACIVGVITGSVPKDVAIPPEVEKEILDRISSANHDRHHSPRSQPPANPDPSSSGGQHMRRKSMPAPELERQLSPVAAVPQTVSRVSGVHGVHFNPSPDRKSVANFSNGSQKDFPDPYRQPSVASTASSTGSESGDSGRFSEYYGPQSLSKFPNEDTAPSWFFERCSREQAEQILIRCPERGNTLMRVSFADNADYAISSRKSGVTTHYAVDRHGDGYRIRAENCTSTLRTLTDVMIFYKQMAGEASTHFLTTNSLEVLLGFDPIDDLYSHRIPPAADVQPAKSDHDSDSAGKPNSDNENSKDFKSQERSETKPTTRCAIRCLEDALKPEVMQGGTVPTSGSVPPPTMYKPPHPVIPPPPQLPSLARPPMEPTPKPTQTQTHTDRSDEYRHQPSHGNYQRQGSYKKAPAKATNEPDKLFMELQAKLKIRAKEVALSRPLPPPPDQPVYANEDIEVYEPMDDYYQNAP